MPRREIGDVAVVQHPEQLVLGADVVVPEAEGLGERGLQAPSRPGDIPAEAGAAEHADEEVDRFDRLVAVGRRGPLGGEQGGAGPLARAVDEARAEAAEHGRAPTSADLVLGILRAGEGMGVLILGHFGVTLERAREAIESGPHLDRDT